MYGKFILLSFAVVGSLVCAHEHPNCKIGNNTKSCTLPDGDPGMFLCLPHPPHPPHHGGGTIGEAILRVVDRITGPDPSLEMDDHMHFGPPHYGHKEQPWPGLKGPRGHHDGPHHGDHKGAHRQLRSPSRSRRSGPPSWSRSGSPRSRRSGMMMMKHHDHHHGMMGRGPHGPADFLSPTICVPVDDKEHPHPPPPPPHGPPPTCGCCGDVCPIKLDCGCTCDLMHSEDSGVWVTVFLLDARNVTRCVPSRAYADSNRVQCVKECSSDMAEEEDDSIVLLEERLGEQDNGLEKESRD